MDAIVKEIVNYSTTVVQIVMARDDVTRKALESDADLKMETIKNLIKLSQKNAVIAVLNETLEKIGVKANGE